VYVSIEVSSHASSTTGFGQGLMDPDIFGSDI